MADFIDKLSKGTTASLSAAMWTYWTTTNKSLTTRLSLSLAFSHLRINLIIYRICLMYIAVEQVFIRTAARTYPMQLSIICPIIISIRNM